MLVLVVGMKISNPRGGPAAPYPITLPVSRYASQSSCEDGPVVLMSCCYQLGSITFITPKGKIPSHMNYLNVHATL